MSNRPVAFHQFTAADQLAPSVRRTLATCWVEVTNAGGAAGFPFPPIALPQAADAVEALVGTLAPETSRILTATNAQGDLTGWLNIRRDPYRLIAHWGQLHHLQTRPSVRGQGYGSALLDEARRVAREDMGLEQLHLAARGGEGLEAFYVRHGWKETGRWPGALRLAPDDVRDEVLMVLDPL
ncbi:GNAT family N-acetyltransferase [Streptomyces sp. NPDC051561]|uniref:GNAT family N-acetyltransferase n=1 Tax=Streptomyces sp. NPDC051561 TaxID=3365658 RepID=UPI003795EE33